MIRLQEINVTLDDGRHVTVYLNELPGIGFEPEIILPAEKGENWRTLFRGSHQRSAIDAYRWAMSEVKRYADRKKVAIAEVDNPCNTEFLPASDQRFIMTDHSMNIQVKVNGC